MGGWTLNMAISPRTGKNSVEPSTYITFWWKKNIYLTLLFLQSVYGLENGALLGCYIAYSGNSLPTLRFCPEMSVWNCHYSQSNNKVGRSFQLLRGGSLKWRFKWLVFITAVGSFYYAVQLNISLLFTLFSVLTGLKRYKLMWHLFLNGRPIYGLYTAMYLITSSIQHCMLPLFTLQNTH